LRNDKGCNHWGGRLAQPDLIEIGPALRQTAVALGGPLDGKITAGAPIQAALVLLQPSKKPGATLDHGLSAPFRIRHHFHQREQAGGGVPARLSELTQRVKRAAQAGPAGSELYGRRSDRPAD
jgi:hypothetical protein